MIIASVPATYTGHIQCVRSLTPVVLTLDINKILLILFKILEEFSILYGQLGNAFSTASLFCAHQLSYYAACSCDARYFPRVGAYTCTLGPKCTPPGKIGRASCRERVYGLV